MPGYQPRHDTDPVWFNGTMVNTLAITSAQAGVRITAVYGWDDRPDVRDVRELRSGQDGEYADNLYIGGRTITLEGEVYGSSWVNLQSRKRTLAALFQPSSDEVLLKIPDPATVSPTTVYATTGMSGYERVSCRVVEAIQFMDSLDPMCQVFQVILRASDPRVYSDTETSTDSGTSGTSARTATVDQGGSYETPPTLTVTGPTASTWSVSEPTSGLVLGTTSLDLVAGETVSFDVLNRTVDYTSTYSGVRLQRGDVIAQWMLAETSGTTADNAQGTSGYDGTYTGGFTLNQSGPVSGVASVELNGSTGYVTVPYSAALNPNAMTLEGWVRFDTTSGTQTVVESFDSNRGWSLKLSSGLLQLTSGDASSEQSHFNYISRSAATWYHVAIVLDAAADSLKLYVDAAPDINTNRSGFVMATSGALQFGRRDTTNYLDGRLSAFTMYNSALSQADIVELYLASAATTTLSGYQYLDASTARWANLGTGSSTYTLDSSGLNTGSKLNVAYRDARL